MSKNTLGLVGTLVIAVIFICGLGGVLINNTNEMKNAEASFDATRTELGSTQRSKVEAEKKLDTSQKKLQSITEEYKGLKQERNDFESKKLEYSQNYENQIKDLQTSVKQKNEIIESQKVTIKQLENKVLTPTQ